MILTKKLTKTINCINLLLVRYKKQKEREYDAKMGYSKQMRGRNNVVRILRVICNKNIERNFLIKCPLIGANGYLY